MVRNLSTGKKCQGYRSISPSQNQQILARLAQVKLMTNRSKTKYKPAHD